MTSPISRHPLAAILISLRTLALAGRALGRLRDTLRAGSASGWRWRRPAEDDSEIAGLMRRANEARHARREEAADLYREVLGRQRAHVPALRALRDLAVEARQWSDALGLEQRLLSVVSSAERRQESEWLAIIHYERGREELATGHGPAALAEFKHALRADRRFIPASVALGDALDAGGDAREAVRVWERAVDAEPSPALLARLERAYRNEGRPSRMTALYRTAAERVPDDLGVAAALGRVYFELEMLDEAADQFKKIEVRAPNVSTVHAFLGAVFERRGQAREAFDEYRRALGLHQAFNWPHRCRACGSVAPAWVDRCSQCGRWNSLGPVDGR